MSKRRLWRGSRQGALCVILDSEQLRGKDILKAASAALRGGADMIQLRDKRSSANDLIKTAKRIAAECRRYSVPFIVNDRIEVAVASGADGIHIGQGDIGIATARKLADPGMIFGVSVENRAQAVRAEKSGASYIGVGPVFKTPIKSSRTPKGIAFLKDTARLGIPVIAIGGIDNTNVGELTRNGIRSIAVIRAVCSSRDMQRATKRLKKALES